MRKSACLLVFTVIFFTLCASYADEGTSVPVQPSRPRVAVLPFDSKGGSAYGLSDALCEQFSTALVNCGRFDVFERRQVEKVLTEQGIGASGMVDPSTAVRIGKVTGCQLIGCGTIIDSKCEYKHYEYKGRTFYMTEAAVTVNYKVLDAETGQVWKQNSITGSASDVGQVDSDSLIRNAALDTVGSFVKVLHPVIVGKIIRVDEDKFIINLGSSHGICASTEFEIVSRGSEITDPSTGEVLGYEQGVKISARPTTDGIQPKMCYVTPGYWKEVHRLLTKEWEWRSDAAKLKNIKVGDEVRTVVPQH